MYKKYSKCLHKNSCKAIGFPKLQSISNMRNKPVSLHIILSSLGLQLHRPKLGDISTQENFYPSVRKVKTLTSSSGLYWKEVQRWVRENIAELEKQDCTLPQNKIFQGLASSSPDFQISDQIFYFFSRKRRYSLYNRGSPESSWKTNSKAWICNYSVQFLSGNVFPLRT